MTIKFWSYSGSKTFDKCPKASEHRYVLKTPKDERDNSAAERGTNLHKEIETYIVETCTNASQSVRQNIHDTGLPTRAPIDPAQFKYEGLIGEIIELCKVHPFTQEEMLYYDRDWNIVSDFKDAWLLMAMDVFIKNSPTSCIIVDWKSGKREGNEIAHQHQGQLYALGAWKRDPTLETIKVIFVYLDHNVKTEAVWKAGHMPRFFKYWDAKGKEITSCTSFKAKPNKWSCKYCDYQSSCDYAIREGDI